MALSREDVQHVANLAHVDLQSLELDEMTVQLASVIEHVQKLRQLDTTGVEPTTQVIPMENVMRADEEDSSWSQRAVLANAPRMREGHFEVTAVMD